MKRPRQEAILELVRKEPLRSQAAILERLRRRGFSVTQPTVSRDIEELGLARIRDAKGRLRYALPAVGSPTGRLDRLRHLLDEFVVGMESSGNVVLLRTPPGAANAVAQSLDESGLEDVLGTVAGDDTILVVAREGVSGSRVRRRLQLLQAGRSKEAG